MRGDRILATIHALEKQGVDFKHTKARRGDQYAAEGQDYTLELTINPDEWLGLVFCWHYSNHTKSLLYSIDTDLYPIAKPDEQEFAQEIEADIVQFAKALIEGRILVGRIKNKPAIVMPVDGGGFYAVIKRWLGATGRAWTKDEFSKLEKDFAPLKK